MPRRLVWLGVRIALPVALVVVTFGYAITGDHTDVWLGAGCGLAIGVGVGLRGGARGSLWTGILVGSVLGVATALLTGAQDLGWSVIIPPSTPLAIGLIDGLGRSSLSGYRDASRETFILAVLLSLGLGPALVVGGVPSWPLVAAYPLLATPWTALLLGLLCQRRKGWRDARPPRLLVLGGVALPILMGVLLGSGVIREGIGLPLIGGIAWIVGTLALSLVVIPVAAFLVGRAAATWLRPRLQVYGQLAAYLRVMWIPIGGFAVGYLTIIFLFAGFYGTLERFSPGAFAGAGPGVTDWLSFAFFNALGQDYGAVVPVSAGARMLVGLHLILSAGWAVVLFAAVMSYIGPKLDRIARRNPQDEGN